jgi:mannose-6-phosphate isomerase-like protein (cupin superfamily)
MLIRSFDPDALRPAHDGTILAQGVFGGKEIGAPFGCAFGVLKPGMQQKPERAPVAKIYYMRYGTATMQIEDEIQTLQAGDVLFIPANSYHSIRNDSDEECSTFAIWWTPVET